MKKVGIKELRNNLSACLHAVKNGETIIITDHNEIIAEINKPNSSQSLSLIEQYLIEQNSLGLLKLASKPKDIDQNSTWSFDQQLL